MKGLALERNEVIFHAMCSVNDGDGCLDLNSRAGRFKSRTYIPGVTIFLSSVGFETDFATTVLKCRQIQRIRMLVCTASLLTTDDYTRLAQEYPDFAFWFDGPLRRAIRGRTDGLNMDSTNDCIDSLFSSGDFDRALQLALELAKARNPLTFARLAVKTFGDEYPERLRVSYEPRRGNLFSEGSLCTLFEWKPEPWRIPSHEELTSIEALLSMKAVRGMETFYSAHNTKWYFSATSVAIQYCKFHIGCSRMSLTPHSGNAEPQGAHGIAQHRNKRRLQKRFQSRTPRSRSYSILPRERKPSDYSTRQSFRINASVIFGWAR